MINFVFMLTHNDATVPNALEVLEELRGSGLRYVGFKDVGASVRGFSFDHVFARGLGAGRWRAGVAADVKDASDHRPVWAVLASASLSSPTR